MPLSPKTTFQWRYLSLLPLPMWANIIAPLGRSLLRSYPLSTQLIRQIYYLVNIWWFLYMFFCLSICLKSRGGREMCFFLLPVSKAGFTSAMLSPSLEKHSWAAGGFLFSYCPTDSPCHECDGALCLCLKLIKLLAVVRPLFPAMNMTSSSYLNLFIYLSSLFT